MIGRFYPNQCNANEGDLLNVQFAGYGYAWTNVTKKITFTGAGAAAYRYDFQVTEGDACDIYSYFRPARVDNASFQQHRIESQMVSVFSGLSSFGNDFGRQTVSKKLQEGFTVIARDGNETQIDFALGIVPLGKRPFHPYQVDSSDGKVTYENDRTEVHQNQRDFVGPIEVPDDGKALTLTLNVDGAPGVDVIVVPTSIGQAWRDQYIQQIGTAGPPSPGRVDEPVAQGVIWRRTVPLPKGAYYVVIDNTTTAGRTSLPANPNDDRAAAVSYGIELGDAP